MSTLNDSRNTSGRPLLDTMLPKSALRGTTPSLCGDGVTCRPCGGRDDVCESEPGFDRSGNTQSEDEDAGQIASSPEQQLSLVRRDVRRHERQIACLFGERHQHCEHLANVYEELEKVLQRIHIAPLQSFKGSAPSSSAAPFSTASSDEDGYAASNTATAPAPSPQQAFHHVLRQHQDRVYDVLLDYRQQIDKHERQTERRLCAIEDALAQIQSDVRDLQHTGTAQSAELRHFQQNVRQSVEAVVTQQEALRASSEVSSEARDTMAAKLMSKIQEDVARLYADTKAMRTQQVQSEKEFEQQIRSLLSAQQKVEQELEVQSASIVRLQNQDSLEGAFHEVKDWLGDLEKRMVSRGELLQWTESLRSEIHQMRRVVGGSFAPSSESAAPSQDA
ncbi:hypothetical protein JKF63_00780 [Porcisia hertigi]|uniref:Uncharacterized protein n=1 Tax=Porcisia hertigi TaxID=2761500 RepID=A0A836L796_9TRYP|nr:hypothetical protein JKF63_00780 [Porcisia hertigi]